MKVLKAFSSVIGWLVGVVMALAIVALLVIQFVPQFKNFDIDNGSMRPTIPIGAKVFVEHESTYKVGDIIAFRADYLQNKQGRYTSINIVHRIVGVNADGSYQTKGDFNESEDHFLKPVTSNDVYGQVTHIVPVAGTINMWTRAHLWLVVVAIFAMALIVYGLTTVSNKSARSSEPADAYEQQDTPASADERPAQSISV